MVLYGSAPRSREPASAVPIVRRLVGRGQATKNCFLLFVSTAIRVLGLRVGLKKLCCGRWLPIACSTLWVPHAQLVLYFYGKMVPKKGPFGSLLFGHMDPERNELNSSRQGCAQSRGEPKTPNPTTQTQPGPQIKDEPEESPKSRSPLTALISTLNPKPETPDSQTSALISRRFSAAVFGEREEGQDEKSLRARAESSLKFRPMVGASASLGEFGVEGTSGFRV